jgi:hypothetical protein
MQALASCTKYTDKSIALSSIWWHVYTLCRVVAVVPACKSRTFFAPLKGQYSTRTIGNVRTFDSR